MSLFLFFFFFFFLMIRRPPRSTLFPTRRSSDLSHARRADLGPDCLGRVRHLHSGQHGRDRKSTRLNSSHTVISYAVFCLKKKKNKNKLKQKIKNKQKKKKK